MVYGHPQGNAESDALVRNYSHLKNLSREKEALHTLKRLASIVKPIMRARNWRVGELAEFYPDQHMLLGLNVNRGQKILLRLRYAGDINQFLPFEQVIDTLLHELSHIVHGPHDAKFHKLWDQLRDEHEGLLMKGFTGDGFLSEGHRLGGGRAPPAEEARRLARAAAQKRKAEQERQSRQTGHRLGGAATAPGQGMRSKILDALDRRAAATQSLGGCGNASHNDSEIRTIAETATRNGFRTQAEEDAANEDAIAQALWELVQEDEKRKHGSSYVPPSPSHPAGNGGGAFLPPEYDVSGGSGSGSGTATRSGSSSNSTSWTPPGQPQNWSAPSQQPRPREVVVTFQPPPAGNSPLYPSRPPVAPPRTPTTGTTRPAPVSPGDDQWECDVCTLHNPFRYLCCDACGAERNGNIAWKMATRPTKKSRT